MISAAFSGQRTAAAQAGCFLFNATLLICAEGSVPEEEIRTFAEMHLPFRIECPAELLPVLGQIPNYQKLHRATFQLTPSAPSPAFCPDEVNESPRLQNVYEILQEGFPNLLEYSLWLTDVSHRCRHGMSKVLTYKNSSTLTLVYDWKGNVFGGTGCDQACTAWQRLCTGLPALDRRKTGG